MRILIVDELCYPQLGGIQVRFKALAEQWVLLGNEVNITAIDHIGTAKEREVINGVTYNRIIRDANYYKTGRFGRKISTIIKYTLKLHPYFKKDYDLIIFCQFPMLPEVFYKLFYHKRANTALDFVEHRGSKLWKIINKVIINSADKVICISEHVKKCTYQYRQTELHVIPSFVDTQNAVSMSKENYIFLGRMEKHKHPELAIEAVIEYNKVHSKNMYLNMVGGGSMLNRLKSEYEAFSFIKFLGSIDEEKKKDLLSNGRLLILPSEREGLPIVVIEAMSYGMPTITANYPGNGTQFFVNDESIGLVALPNKVDIANKIHQVENNYNYFVDRCNAIKYKYDLRSISEKYLNIFR